MKAPTVPRTGSREMTEREVEVVQALHAAANRLRYQPGGQRDRARTALQARLVVLYDDGVPVTHLGAAMGVSGQRAQQLVAEGRES